MSEFVVFENKGLIDLRAVRTFGVSVKEGENPIGYFGTGVKYALAVLLREGCQATLWRGSERFDFAVQPHTVRGRSFGVVAMNDEALAFTAELGKNWELWQAFRELYCNATDEGGSAHALDADPGAPGDDETRIVVHGGAFASVFHDRARYVLCSTPIYSTPSVEIHAGASDALFYRGVRVCELRRPSVFTYNILRKMDLTEDRTLHYRFYADWAVRDLLVECTDATIIRAAVSGGRCYEGELDFVDGVRVDPAPTFLEVAGEFNRRYEDRVNRTAVSLYRRVMRASAVADTEAQMPLNMVQQAQLERASNFLVLLGVDLSLYPVRVVEDLGEGILGLAENKTIFVSRMAFEQGTKMLAGTLFEEWVHLHHHHTDCTREMQNYLVDRLMTLGELSILKEPL